MQLQKDQVFTLSTLKPIFVDRRTRIQVTPLGGGETINVLLNA